MTRIVSTRAPSPSSFIAALACALAFALCSCADRPGSATHEATSATRAAKAASFIAPQDVFERTPAAIVGITYPPGLERFPDLAALLAQHSASRRAVLTAALQRTPSPSTPYELMLRYTTLADAPRMFAVSADEELYTGGLASRPGHAVFLWLPAENRLMSPDELIPDPASWTRLHEYIRERGREEAATLAPTAAATQTAPARGMRHVFTPRFNSGGRIAGLRFRIDDDDEIEVPGVLLKPLVAPAYADWFDDTPLAPSANPTANL